MCWSNSNQLCVAFIEFEVGQLAQIQQFKGGLYGIAGLHWREQIGTLKWKEHASHACSCLEQLQLVHCNWAAHEIDQVEPSWSCDWKDTTRQYGLTVHLSTDM